MLHKPLHERRGNPQFPATADEGAFVRGTRAFAKFLTGVLSLLALAFAVGLAWGALRAGVTVAERLLMP